MSVWQKLPKRMCERTNHKEMTKADLKCLYVTLHLVYGRQSPLSTRIFRPEQENSALLQQKQDAAFLLFYSVPAIQARFTPLPGSFQAPF